MSHMHTYNNIITGSDMLINQQGSLWSGTSYKTLIHNIGKLIFNISQSNHKYHPPVKKTASKNRIFYTCSKLMYSHSIVKIYSTYSHSIVIPYLKHSHQSVILRSSDSGQIVVRQSGYTKMISYNSIPYGFLKHVPQQFPRAPT